MSATTPTGVRRGRDYEGAAGPTVDNDSSLGYLVGDRWVVTGASTWTLTDATATAAIWLEEDTGGGGGGGAPTNAQYVTLATDATLTQERVLAVGTGLSLTDAGAGNTVTIAPALDLAALEALSTTGLAVRTGTSTWTTRTLGAPAAGLTWSNGDGVAGAPTLALANDLAALEGLGSTGLAVRTAADTWAQRTLQAPAAGFTVTNPAGVAGDPTFVLADDLSGLEGLSTTGLSVRTGTSTWTTRTMVAPAAGLTIADAGGVAGAPTFALANDIGAIEALTGTGFAQRTGTDTWSLQTLTDVQRITATGYTTVTLPTGYRFVTFIASAGGGAGGAGEVGNATAARRGGGSGGGSGYYAVTLNRDELPSTIYVYIGAGGTPSGSLNSGSGLNTLVELTNTSYAGSATVDLTTAQGALLWVTGGTGGVRGAGGGAAGAAGSAGPITSMTWGLHGRAPVVLGGKTGSSAQASGASPTDLNPFSAGNIWGLGACAGGGNAITTQTPSVGGQHSAKNLLSATVGGVINGGAGNPGLAYDGSVATTVLLEHFAKIYGGTGGGGGGTGTGGTGGNGVFGQGGGGAGGGATGAPLGGSGGDGWCLIIGHN